MRAVVNKMTGEIVRAVGFSQVPLETTENEREIVSEDTELLKAFFEGRKFTYDLTNETFIIEPAPPTEIDLIKQENEDLKNQLASTNADFQALMDYLAETGVI